ncbi:PilZ domain-containing protein [bacterium]|nr:PilZ domain-containing protein [bacterium]NUP93934.1 PilZ domain-containing protein [Candidatus Omnitrophota bacterium]
MDEQRGHQRLKTQVLVEIKIQKTGNGQMDIRYIEATTRDLSAGGIFIELAGTQFSEQSDFRVDDFLLLKYPIQLRILLPNQEDLIQAEGKAVWIEKRMPGEGCRHGVAITFTLIDPQDRNAIDHFVLSRL